MPDIEDRREPIHFEKNSNPPKGLPEYYELNAVSNFSFLQGASHPEELVHAAYQLGIRGIAVTDVNSFAGIIRAYKTAQDFPLQYIVGVRLELQFVPHIPTGNPYEILTLLAYPTNRNSYGNVCELLSIGKRRCEKGKCRLSISDFLQFQDEVVGILVPPVFIHSENISAQVKQENFRNASAALLTGLKSTARYSLSLARSYLNNAPQSDVAVFQLANDLNLPLVATNEVQYHIHSRKPLHDVLCCIRNKTNIFKAGFLLQQNAERYLKSPQEIMRLFKDIPAAVQRTKEIAEWTKGFSLAQLRYEYPQEICPEGISPTEYLHSLTWQGAAEKFPQGVPEDIAKTIKEEFQLIEELKYEKYFLTCYDIVRYARSIDILCQGRGAAANSAVCYCLGITSVNPSEIKLLFARFISKERNEPPDIDIDFEHERREEVIQYIYNKYGREHAGITATVTTYRGRSAMREVGKALGLSLEIVNKLTALMHRWTENAISAADLIEIGLSPDDLTIKNCFRLAQELRGFPRHLGQHVGGFIISLEALHRTVPLLNATMKDRTIIEWDKDDIEVLGMLKIDVLALGMLTCIRKALEFVNNRPNHLLQPLQLHTVPEDDSKVYEMICRADTIGVFQIESRAQMSMLPRLRPKKFYDLVIEVAIVRPGPIQGNMVHPYLKRKNGLEAMQYPDKRVEEILSRTLGVPIFQEQAMRLVIVLAGFSPGEAEMLRRSMASWKRNKNAIAQFESRILLGMKANGLSEEFAQNCVNQIKGFGEYGFPESHAASFARLVYVSAWLKCHYPAEFAAALINSQPMGFYSVSQIIQDAQRHGVSILEIDVNESEWGCKIEVENNLDFQLPRQRACCVRLGMRCVKGITEQDALHIQETVKQCGPFKSILDLWQASQAFSTKAIRKTALLAIARADGFSSMGLSQRDALWQIHSLPDNTSPLPTHEPQRADLAVALPKLSAQRSMFSDYKHTGFSIKAHPIQFIRQMLTKQGVFSAEVIRTKFPRPKAPLEKMEQRIWVSVAGLVTVRQRPGTAKGTVFLSLEDETGTANLILRPKVFEQYQKLTMMSVSLLASGRLERVGEVTYVTVSRLESLDEFVLKEIPKGTVLPCLSYSH